MHEQHRCIRIQTLIGTPARPVRNLHIHIDRSKSLYQVCGASVLCSRWMVNPCSNWSQLGCYAVFCYVLLTVHPCIIFFKWIQAGAHYFVDYLFRLSTCFGQLCAHHQENLLYLCDTGIFHSVWVAVWSASSINTLYGPREPDDGDTTLLQHVGSYLPVDKV